jgi:hypothetical protein
MLQLECIVDPRVVLELVQGGFQKLFFVLRHDGYPKGHRLPEYARNVTTI